MNWDHGHDSCEDARFHVLWRMVRLAFLLSHEIGCGIISVVGRGDTDTVEPPCAKGGIER